MKLNRRELRRLIESVINEENSRDDVESVSYALDKVLKDWIESGKIKPETKELMQLAGFGSAVSHVAGSALEGAAGLLPAYGYIPVISSLLAGMGLGIGLHITFSIDRGEFKNNVISRAAMHAGLDVGMYTQPSVDEIMSTGFGGLRPFDVDPKFKRQLGVLHMLSKTLPENEKPEIVKQYESFLESGIINEDLFDKYSKEVEKDLSSQIETMVNKK